MSDGCARYLVTLGGVSHRVYVRRDVCDFAPDPLGLVRGLHWHEARERLVAMGALVERIPEGEKR